MSFESRHVCGDCGSPQPMRPGEDYFSAFDIPRVFSQDRQLLEKRFYSLSRSLHPDRFSGASAERLKKSLERMSFVNDAYRTLKDPKLLREYLLSLEKIALQPETPGMSGLPRELAESWFELQEAAMDNPAQAGAEILKFSEKLDFKSGEVSRQVEEGEREYDRTRSVETLRKIGAALQVQNYLRSLTRNVDQLRQRIPGA